MRGGTTRKDNMPNWNKNITRLTGPKEQLDKAVKRLKNRKGELTFNKIVPMPRALEDTVSPTKIRREELIKKYGDDNWYDWRCNNWGVKWDASESTFYKEDGYVDIEYETPWCPPIEFWEKFTKQFPEISVEGVFADEFIGQTPTGRFFSKQGTASYKMENEDQAAQDFADKVWRGEFVE